MSGIVWQLMAQGAGWGFLAGVTIGPFLGYMINVVLNHGARRALPLVFVPPLVDTPIIIFTVVLLARVSQLVLDGFRLVGGAFVLLLAYSAWRQYRRGLVLRGANAAAAAVPSNVAQAAPTTPEAAPASAPRMPVFVNGLLVNALNPAPYLFWSVVSGPVLAEALRENTWLALAFLVPYYATFIGLMLVLIWLIARLGNANWQASRRLQLAAVVLLVVLGTALMGQGMFNLVAASPGAEGVPLSTTTP